MSESPWTRRFGPGIAALGAVALVASTALGGGERGWDPPPCPPGARTSASTVSGAWYRLDPVLEAGALTGQRLAMGRGATRAPGAMRLPPEAVVGGPVGGIVVVAADDGTESTVTLIDLSRGCASVVGSTTEVIRAVTLTPDGSAVLEARVDRTSRADLGVARRAVARPRAAARWLDPLPPDARFGMTWATSFTWAVDGRRLAVQTCGERACRTRIVEGTTAHVIRTVDDPELADAVGLTADALVAHGACGGLPCPIVAVPVAGGRPVTLAAAAGEAALTSGDDGRVVVVHETRPDGGTLRVVRLDGTHVADLPADPLGRRLVPGAGRSGGAVELPPDAVVLGPGGRLPDGNGGAPVIRRPSDGRVVNLEEISR